MPNPNEMGVLQHAADYTTVRKNVRGSGIAALIFGLLALFAGVLPPFDLLLAGLGLMLTVTGLWNITNPHPTGIVLGALAIIMVGLYNVAGTLLASAAGQGGGTHWAVLGVFQVIWGVQGFGNYKRFAQAFASRPSDTDREQADRMLKELRAAKTKESEDVIEFTGSQGMQALFVKVRLMPDRALCLVGNGDDVRLVPKAAFDVSDQGKAMIGSGRKVQVSMNGTLLKGEMSPESVRRFEVWKHGVARPRPIAA